MKKYLSYIEYALIFLTLIFVILTYSNLITELTSEYLPATSDEYLYYVNAKSFYINDTLSAAITFSGNGSYLLSSDAHGFTYSLFN